MDASIIIPVQDSEAEPLVATLDGALAQRYDGGRIEVVVVRYGSVDRQVAIAPSFERQVRFLSIDHPSPYAARNLAVAHTAGDAILFTEPGCVPDAEWVSAHVETLNTGGVTISVGHVAPSRPTWLVDVFMSYENVRDAWVFSCDRWQHYFGRPKNMAVARHRFESHGPFVEVMRGADSKLVQRVARELSCNEVALTQNAIVRQQSVRGLPSCYRDRFRHARALRIHRSAHAAPISLDQRLRLFRETLAQPGYGPGTAATLFALLGAGILAFRLGGWTGALGVRSRGGARESPRHTEPR
jgi:glycosyltransferase involved in cell wall biosynthesis